MEMNLKRTLELMRTLPSVVDRPWLVRQGHYGLEVLRREGAFGFLNALAKAAKAFHHEAAAARSLPPWLADRGSSGRALIIDARMITPDRDSGSHRLLHLLDLFAELGYSSVFVPADLNYPLRYTQLLQERGVKVPAASEFGSMEGLLRQFGRQFDVILISRADTAAWLLPVAKRAAPGATILFDTVDLHFLREERLAEITGDPELAARARWRRHQESALAALADATLVVSPVEARLLNRIAPRARVAVVSNIHTARPQVTPYQERKDIFFIGSFEHRPNVDAVWFYIREVAPRLRPRLPGVKTYLIGSDPPADMVLAADEHLVVTGHVADLDPYLNGCRLSVAPLRAGAGVKGKVNLSMSYGVPVVATSIAVEGTHLEHERDVLIADDGPAFAEQVVRLYRDPQVWNKLSQNGRINIERYFSRRAAKTALASVLPGPR